MILCLGCNEKFLDREGYRNHVRETDHPDMGEKWSGKARV